MTRPPEWGDGQWPRLAPYVMREIADRIGVLIDPRTVVPSNDIENAALEMSMREIAGHIAAMMGGVWTITDDGCLYCVPLGMAAQALADENGVLLLFGGEAALCV